MFIKTFLLHFLYCPLILVVINLKNMNCFQVVSKILFIKADQQTLNTDIGMKLKIGIIVMNRVKFMNSIKSRTRSAVTLFLDK